MSATAQSGADAGGDRDRIVNLSDGVFAIAIVLLVLDIRVPNIPEKLVASELPGELLSLWPQCLGYVLSFVSISVFWMIHHAIFRPIRSYDRTLLYLNFLFLMLGASLPHGAPWRVRRPPTAGGHLRRDPCDRQAALDGHTLVLDEERPAACRAPRPGHGTLLPDQGLDDTSHLLALDRDFLLQRGRGHLDVVHHDRHRRNHSSQEIAAVVITHGVKLRPRRTTTPETVAVRLQPHEMPISTRLWLFHFRTIPQR